MYITFEDDKLTPTEEKIEMDKEEVKPTGEKNRVPNHLLEQSCEQPFFSDNARR